MSEFVLPRARERRRYRRPTGPLWGIAVAAAAFMLGCLAWNLVALHRPAQVLYAGADGCWVAGWWPVVRRRGYPPLDIRWLLAGFAMAAAGMASEIVIR